MEKLNLFDIPRFYQLIQLDIDRFPITHSTAWYVYGVLAEQHEGEDDFYNEYPHVIRKLSEQFSPGSSEAMVSREVYELFIEEEYVDQVMNHVEELCKQSKNQNQNSD